MIQWIRGNDGKRHICWWQEGGWNIRIVFCETDFNVDVRGEAQPPCEGCMDRLLNLQEGAFEE